MPIIATLTTQITEMTESQQLSTHPVRPAAKPTTAQRNLILEPMQQIDHPLGSEDRRDRIRVNGRTHRTMQMEVSSLRPKL